VASIVNGLPVRPAGSGSLLQALEANRIIAIEKMGRIAVVLMIRSSLS
jgi:hypothetical protein